MKYILLDLDGVMITTPPWKMAEMLDDGFSAFNPKAVINLNRIISQTSASIILTTSHRNTYDSITWQELFIKREVICKDILIMRSNKTGLTRADQILLWYNEEGTDKKFVVIDDDNSINGLPLDIKERCIVTKPLIGLDEWSAMNAIAILNK